MSDDQNFHKELKEYIYSLSELNGSEIAKILIPIYKRVAGEKTAEERLGFISNLWSHLEEILNTTDHEKMHPYFKTQEYPGESKKGILGNAWEQMFEMLANEFLESLNVIVIRLSKENVDRFVEAIGPKILEKKFNVYKKFGLINEGRFSKGRIVDTFYNDIIKQGNYPLRGT